MRPVKINMRILPAILAFSMTVAFSDFASDKVNTLRVPEGGIQPQAVVDAKGGVHLIYFKGDPANGDIFYVKLSPDGAKFSKPIQVNSNAESAIAVGNVRGPHIAIGKNERVHVAWMGSGKAPKGPNNSNPMLYTRLTDDGSAFEPERNVMQFATGLDGGGTVAADPNGNVIVTWHANPAKDGEINRQVWLARSSDEGKSFKREEPAISQQTGACGCCGMSALADGKGDVFILYRSARGAKMPDIRDMFLLTSKDKGATFSGADLHPWKLPMCAMSTANLSETSNGALAAWETKGQVYFCHIDAQKQAQPIGAPGAGTGRKHPAVAGNAAGEVLLAWTNGMGWQKGGSVEWQVYGKDGAPAPATADKGKTDGVPANSVITAFTRPDGGFTIIY